MAHQALGRFCLQRGVPVALELETWPFVRATFGLTYQFFFSSVSLDDSFNKDLDGLA